MYRTGDLVRRLAGRDLPALTEPLARQVEGNPLFLLATLHHHEGRVEQAISILNAARSLVCTPDEHAAFKATENLILGESTKVAD